MLHKLTQLAAWTAIAFVAFATLTTAPKVRRLYSALSPIIRQRNDSRFPQHVVHVLVFALIGSLLAFGYPTNFILVLTTFMVGIAVLEAMQNLIPDRHGTLSDALWKMAGAAVGVGAAQMFARLLF